MNLLGYSLDNLSLMALTLAIGFLVDDAIVFLENVSTPNGKIRGNTGLLATLNAVRSRNQLHHSQHDHLAGAVFIPLLCYVGIDGSNLPRVQRHHRDRDLRQRYRFADTDAR